MNHTPLPEWLGREETYTPLKDKDAFINKSILSLLDVLSRIQTQAAHHESRFQTNAAIKLVFTLLLVILMSLTRSFAFIMVIITVLLCVLCLLPARELARVLRNSFFAALFTAVVLLPTLFMGNWYSILMLTPKVFASVTLLSLLANRTRWDSLTGALKVFFIPDIFIFVLDIAIKYILLLGEYTLNMLYALRLRSIGRNNNKYTSLSGIAGTMFMRSREMAEEMHAAMECRGFTGEYSRPSRFSFHLMDAGLITLAAMAVLLFLYLK